MDDACTVPINNESWRTHGGRMMKWIDYNVGSDCYKLRFSDRLDRSLVIIFNNNSQATLFKLCVLHGGLEVLGEKTKHP